MRKVPFVQGEYYHIYNRGTDKRNVFTDKYDVYRFLESMEVFNAVEPVGSIRESAREPITDQNMLKRRRPTSADERLVNIICFCLNPNHYHFILEQLVDGGISEFMKRLGGYTKYYNEKYKRSGVLFQGRFKSVHIGTNEQLLWCSVYVNLNNRVHKKFNGIKKHFLDLISGRSSWNEYVEKSKINFCNKNIILGHFKSIENYKKFAEETLEGIKEMRYDDK